MKWMSKLTGFALTTGLVLLTTGGNASVEPLSTERHVHGVITSVEPTRSSPGSPPPMPPLSEVST